MSNILDHLRNKAFQWFPHSEMGYLRPALKDTLYNEAYFQNYVCLANTDIGIRLNKFRLSLVEKFVGKGMIVDIGVGSCTFLEAHGNCVGYDVNPTSIDMLLQDGLFINPYIACLDEIVGITFWDSLEHISDPKKLIDRVRDQFVFVSIPIFKNLAGILSSKHYKPDEHCWYFTENGFVTFMRFHGFAILYHSEEETMLGREDIHTFVFKRPEENALSV